MPGGLDFARLALPTARSAAPSGELAFVAPAPDVMKVGRVHWPVWADGFKRARFV